ncbi:MAG: LuxR C-terminal-related transcriptional regulator [Gordonibacter sp.]|uniref:helix-turn-helix transcriptional regulator n=1 Tax=Gordonibacter sp. TaxID=1968902 RepID=UPI002FCBA689
MGMSVTSRKPVAESNPSLACEARAARTTPESTTDAPEHPGGREPFWERYTNIPFRLLGYGMLMGWHFLLLYFLIQPLSGNADPDVLFFRQMALNVSLVCVFALLAALGRKDFLPSPGFSIRFLVAVSALAAVATACTVLAALQASAVPMIAFTVIAGATEAVLLMAWLHYYSESSDDYATQYIAFSLIIGAAVAFFTHHLTPELGWGCFVVLPVLSTLMLSSSMKQTPIRSAEQGERGVRDHEGAMRPLAASTLNLVVYGAVFGFLQGSGSADGGPILTIFSPNTVIGAGLAGVLTLLAYHKVPGKRAAEALRRSSLMLFVTGVLLIAVPSPLAKDLAGNLVMMGFITADITVLVYVVHLIRAYDLNSFFAIGLNRAAEYAAFALFIAIGAALAKVMGGASYYLPTVCGLSTVIVLGYTLLSMGEGRLDWIHQLYAHEPADQVSEGENEPERTDEAAHAGGRWKMRCRIICERSALSPRESEVFTLMAKGRNADYIQGALVISGYTAKTHIANIYRKVEVHSLQELIDLVEQVDLEAAENQHLNHAS